ncbi:MAG: transporter-like protein permease [Ramlibacter sp.]|jgi:ABC-type nitrate/sulfonate/bicarbonate transport system permease component|nr:transporter-like protein permease [Ramlibacter sp.]MDB5912435.1 transporter-like protein permease [Ramlibacter sp.]
MNPLRALGWFVSRFWGVLLIVAAWEAWVLTSGFNSIVIARPADVVNDVIQHPELYLPNAAHTLGVALLGLVLGMVVGTGAAIAAWSSALLGGLLAPLTLVFSSIPVVAVIPIIARLLGYDTSTVLAVVVIISFFPSFVFTASGLRALPPGSADLFRVLGASRMRTLWRLALPAALPNWMTALRGAAPQAVMAATLAEFLMASSGLGHIFHQAKDELDMARALGASLVVSVMAVVVFLLASAAETRVRAHWR